MNIYIDNGFETRSDYLESLSVKTGIDLATVQMLAEELGVDEDFDALVSVLTLVKLARIEMKANLSGVSK